VANEIVGNGADEAALEITLLGPELRMEQSSVIAIAGADLGATVDGRAVPLNVAIACREAARCALPADVAAAAPTWRCAAVSPCRVCSAAARPTCVAVMGGLAGRALRAGDRLPIGTEVRASHDRGAWRSPR
jgi:antagonist of KipI